MHAREAAPTSGGAREKPAVPRPRAPEDGPPRPAAGRPRRTSAGVALRALAVGAAYGLMSLLVTVVTSFGTEIGAVFWPGAGVTVAALLLRPRAEWPAILTAVFVAEVVLDLTVGDFGVRTSLAFGVANCTEAFVGALLLARLRCLPPDLGRMRDVLAFTGSAVVAGPAVGAFLGTALPALLVGDPWFPRLPRWFLGDAVGVLVVGPLLLTFRSAHDLPVRRWAGPLLALFAVCVLVVGPWVQADGAGLEYVLVPSLVFLAIRLRSAGAARGLAVTAVTVEAFSAASHGPFSAADGRGISSGQTFLGMTGLCVLVVAALTNELVARERAEARLRADALQDPLTGAGNRRLLAERLGHALDRIRRNPDGGLAVYSVDLDGFKDVNDRHGHAAGDAVLVEVARRLTETVRTGDTVCRTGGDEFVVLIEDLTDEAAAAVLARRLDEEVRRPMSWRGVTLEPAASIGLAMCRSGQDSRAEDVLTAADLAMYEVKRAARSTP